MKIHKRTALGAAGALAATSVMALTLGVSPASAATISSDQISGSPVNQAGETWYDTGAFPRPATPPSPAQATIELTVVEDAANGEIDVTVGANQGPYSSQLAGMAAGTYRLDSFIEVNGTPQRMIGTPGAVAVGTNAPSYVGGWANTATYSVGIGGSYTVELTDLLMDSSGQGNPVGFGTLVDGSDADGFDAWYNGASVAADIVARTTPIGISESGTLPLLPSFAVTGNADNQSVANAGRAGDTYPIAISNFEPNATVTISGIQVFGAPANHVIGTVTTDASGSYVGSTPPIPNTVPTGLPWRLRATDGVNTVAGANNSDIIALYGTPTITVPSPVSANATFTATGTNWNAAQSVTLTLYNGAVAGSSGSGIASTGSGFAIGGAVSINVTPDTSDIGSDSVEATQVPPVSGPTLTASAPIEVSALSCVANPECSVTQTLQVEVTTDPNGLRLGETDNFTDFGSHITQPTDNTVNAALDTTTVYDGRGGSLGWSSVAFVADPFVGANSASHTIPQSNLSIAVTCAPTTDASPAGGPAVVAAPLAGNTATTPSGSHVAFPAPGDSTPAGSVPLCSVPNVASGNGGAWTQALDANLVIPAFQAADVYTTTMTVVLTANS